MGLQKRWPNSGVNMKALMRKTIDMWVPADKASLEMLRKYKHGDEVAFKVSNPRSLRQNNLWHEFLDMVFENQEKYKTKESLLYTLCIAIGHHNQKIRLTKDGEYVVILERKSTSFENCKQSEFQEFFDSAKEWVATTIGIDFDEWQESTTEGKCQMPNCPNPATQTHHIIPGTASRKICDDLGLVVKICDKCHYNAHHGFQKGAYLTFCKVLNVDPVETWKKVKG